MPSEQQLLQLHAHLPQKQSQDRVPHLRLESNGRPRRLAGYLVAPCVFFTNPPVPSPNTKEHFIIEKRHLFVCYYCPNFKIKLRRPCEAKLCWSATGMMARSSKGQFYNEIVLNRCKLQSLLAVTVHTPRCQWRSPYIQILKTSSSGGQIYKLFVNFYNHCPNCKNSRLEQAKILLKDPYSSSSSFRHLNN